MINKLSFTYYWIMAIVTVSANILNILPGNNYEDFINLILWNDNSIMEIVDLVFLSFTLIFFLISMRGKTWTRLSVFCLLMLLFFIGEEASYGMHFNEQILFIFEYIDGASEGNFHGANLIPGFGVELINFFYIFSGPFFLWFFDERGALKKILPHHLPHRFLTTHQLLIYVIGCLILPFDGLDNDVELNQFYHTSIYAILLMYINNTYNSKESFVPTTSADERLMKFAQWCSLIPLTRGIVYYYFSLK